MKIEKWSKETGEVAIILSSHEYADLGEALLMWTDEHVPGDGTCNVHAWRAARQIANTPWGKVE